MPRKVSGNALNKNLRVHQRTIEKLKSILPKMKLPEQDRKLGYVVDQLCLMYEEKKIGTSPFLEERQSPSLNQGALITERDEYKFLYEESQKSNTNYVKVVQKLANQLGISYSDAMELRVDATIQQ